MSVHELTKAIAQHNQKRMMKPSSQTQMPKRCRFYAACHQHATSWAWHTYLQKRLAVCDRCLRDNEYLVPAKR